MKIPFTKAHGAMNDFLLTWQADVPEGDRPAMARAICDRHTGVGADGWMIVTPADDLADGSIQLADGSIQLADGSIQLYNSDGSAPEISGNGTRCAAAFLILHGGPADVVRIRTGAGIKTLRTLRRDGRTFDFEMDMGRARILAAQFSLALSTGPRDVTLIDVGNPQCAVPVEDFDFDWRAMGKEIESHPHFPHRTNVSFIRPVDRHRIDVRFYERGAGETMSSGTGSTGAGVAAVSRGIAESPVEVMTPAGSMQLRLQESLYLTGPAEIVAQGEFFAAVRK
jgi:diaminopimelate epimerase